MVNIYHLLKKNLLAVYYSRKGHGRPLINDKICNHFVLHKELLCTVLGNRHSVILVLQTNLYVVTLTTLYEFVLDFVF